MRTAMIIILIFASAALIPHAQVATDENLGSTPTSPLPKQSANAEPKIPERAQIDEIFKQTSLGKEADERRLHIEWRQFQNEVVNAKDLTAAKRPAATARTHLEKPY